MLKTGALVIPLKAFIANMNIVQPDEVHSKVRAQVCLCVYTHPNASYSIMVFSDLGAVLFNWNEDSLLRHMKQW